MPEPIAPRPHAEPVVGLLASVAPIFEPNLRWAGAGGYSLEQFACDGGGVEDPCAVINRTESIPRKPAAIEGNAFGVWQAAECSPMDRGGDFSVLRDAAEMQLKAVQSKRIAEELWGGAQARYSGWDNQYLTSLAGDTLTDAGAVTPTSALACLEQYLGDCSGGARGMIHAPRQVVTYWSENGLVRRENGLILTVHDTIVVPDAGYDGSGPQGEADGDPTPASTGHVWAYATSIVTVRLGPIEILPTSEADLWQVTDRTTNLAILWANRLAAVSWDTCCHAAAEMNLPLCGIGGAGS